METSEQASRDPWPTRAGPDAVGDAIAGIEPPVPDDRAGEPIAVRRSFAFVDITGFTSYCDRYGDREAIALLTRFRSHVRDIAARRGVRVAKWLGDGVMLVAVDDRPLVAAVTELVVRCAALGIDTHAGICAGTALLFEGDDYVGRPANVAARLCDVALPGQVLATQLRGPLPNWVEDRGPFSVWARGVGELDDVHDLRVTPTIAVELKGDGAAA
ncbi:adenylate/guanylate cyclase domain-containing protein [Rhabdothermincola sp.]|uniref:adenylate/guanylate cyclase domain-containing protein n=1 Tax=Rhabdothermincola sp. TaxID=2820405 RepID=UPI002FE0D529